ncbi:hypothetical protein [Corynebacterium sp. p3-SID1194]|nr:hypothetical protein [Corynebacterium sp. p3-SID1194]
MNDLQIFLAGMIVGHLTAISNYLHDLLRTLKDERPIRKDTRQ